MSEVVVHWSLCRAEEHLFLELGEAPAWLLTARERTVFAGLKVPKRRKDWLLGRFAAKRLCWAWLTAQGRAVELEEISVLAADDGSPRLELEGEGALPVTLTLSHRAGVGLCALVEGVRAPLGADLELCEPRPALFAEDFFTAAEGRALPASGEERWRAMAELWSLKESALKALRVGLREDTRSVAVGPRTGSRDGWATAPLELRLSSAPAQATGFARWDGALVSTLAWLGAGVPVLQRAGDHPITGFIG